MPELRTADSTTTPSGHMQQLDGLRAIAVGGVLGTHYLGWTWLHTGGMGVELFFVLSGFLITGILLRAKAKCEAGRANRLASLRVFYIRRSLRIFPLYFAILTVAFLLFPETRPGWIWHVTYTANIYAVLQNCWFPRLGVFWSLCVEEQFYLVWPWLILIAPMRYVRMAIICMLFLGPLSRSLILFYPLQWSIFTTSNLDALGAGALLALLRSPWSGVSTIAFASLTNKSMVLGFAFSCFLLAVRDQSGWQSLYQIFWFTALMFLWFGMVGRASIGFEGLFERFLACKPMAYLGKISYGIYVYHLFIPSLTHIILKTCGLDNRFFRLPTTLALLLIVTSASWWFFENPINQLKERKIFQMS